MKVYIVSADLWSCADLVAKDDSLGIMNHYDAMENRAVFSSKEKAEAFANELRESNKLDVENLGCDHMEYVVNEWEVI